MCVRNRRTHIGEISLGADFCRISARVRRATTGLATYVTPIVRYTLACSVPQFPSLLGRRKVKKKKEIRSRPPLKDRPFCSSSSAFPAFGKRRKLFLFGKLQFSFLSSFGSVYCSMYGREDRPPSLALSAYKIRPYTRRGVEVEFFITIYSAGEASSSCAD